MLQCSMAVALGGRAVGGRRFSGGTLAPEALSGALSQTFSLPDRLGRAVGPGSFFARRLAALSGGFLRTDGAAPPPGIEVCYQASASVTESCLPAKLHPADAWTRERIVRATAFTAVFVR